MNAEHDAGEKISIAAQKEARSRRHYVVVGRCRASAVFAPDDHLSITYHRQGMEPVRLLFRTRYVDRGFDVPIPEDLWLDARGGAENLNDAAELSLNGARDIANVVGLACNAHMGQLEAEIAFENTPGAVEHEYFQSFLPEKPVTVIPGRRIDVPAALSLLAAIQGHASKDRIVRAIAQYSVALENWRPGHELLSVAHLFMAVEALKQVTLKRILRVREITAEELAQEWGYKGDRWKPLRKFLQDETRRRLIFDGDAECHRKAKSVSDNFEHGFEDFGKLRSVAAQVVVRTAAHVRKAIIEASDVDETIQATLLSPPFDKARGPLQIVKYFRGRLIGDEEELAAPDQAYPYFEWRSGLKSVQVDDTGQYSFTPDESFTAHISAGIQFKPESYEAWDGSMINEVPISPELGDAVD